MDLYTCWEIEQSPTLVLAACIIGVLILAAVFAVLVYLSVKAGTAVDKIETETAGPLEKIIKRITISGGGARFASFLAGLVAIYGGATYVYDKSATYYEKSIEIPEGSYETVASVKELLSRDKRTHLRIIVLGNAGDVRIKGTYYGQCIADLLQSICGKNDSLNYIRDDKGRSMTIRLANSK